MLVVEEKSADSPTKENEAGRVERYEIRNRRLLRSVRASDGKWIDTDFGPAPARGMTPGQLHAIADLRYLQSKTLPLHPTTMDEVKITDLFGGIGALTLGVTEAARAVGRSAELVLAADSDPAPLEVLRKTFGVDANVAREADLGVALRGKSSKRTRAEAQLLGQERRELDILVAGPPCQGHSRLNNHTRHDDPRNDLYRRVARFVDLERPRLVLIENVDSVVNDQRRSASDAADALRKLGYHVDEDRVSLHQLGVPQKRRRHVLVATRSDQRQLSITDIVTRYGVDEPDGRNLKWAIGDLEDGSTGAAFDESGVPSEANKARMRWRPPQQAPARLPSGRR